MEFVDLSKLSKLPVFSVDRCEFVDIPIRERRDKKAGQGRNSVALVIDRPILDLLKIDAETPLDISTDGQRLIVAPAAISKRRAKFDAGQQWAHKRHDKAFKRLAE